MSREGRAPRLVEPEEMVPPLLYIVSCEADQINGWRFEIKWVFGFAKARYRGLKKNTHRLLVTAAGSPICSWRAGICCTLRRDPGRVTTKQPAMIVGDSPFTTAMPDGTLRFSWFSAHETPPRYEPR